ncbi:uncharacterized protein LOC143768721 [Ranitomeya variabilis]|uniref:uncharacterized protein LOC143768721 n=1 Tax=Ranitomeya variabilis TaxID=490064 RepID=UPI00405632CA
MLPPDQPCAPNRLFISQDLSRNPPSFRANSNRPLRTERRRMERVRSPSHLFQGPSVMYLSRGTMIYRKMNLSPETAPPPDYFVLSIVATIFFFLTLGFVALYFSLKTRDCLQRGDVNMADRYSHIAFVANMIAVGVGFLAWMSLFAFLYSQQRHLLIYELHNAFNLTQTFNITE